MKWHIIAYRKYKDDCLRFNKRLRRLEREGTKLNKDTIEEIRTLKWYRKEVVAHMEDARREIDINRRKCRSFGIDAPDEDEISEQDIDTDVALGDASTSDSAPSPPKKKRKAEQRDDSDSDRAPQSSRPKPKKKSRPEEQKAKDAFKARFMQEQPTEKTGIKLKIPRNSFSPEVALKKAPANDVAPIRSLEKNPAKGAIRIKAPEKKPIKLDEARTEKRAQEAQSQQSRLSEGRPGESRPQESRRPKESRPQESRPQESRPQGSRPHEPQPQNSRPQKIQSPAASGPIPHEPPSPAQPLPVESRPKPRRCSKPPTEKLPTKETESRRESATSEQTQDVSRPQSLPLQDLPPAPSTVPGPNSGTVSAPLFMDPPEVSRRLPPRQDQWTFASEMPSVVSEPTRKAPATGRNGDEAVVVDDFPSPVALPADLPVRSEPVSPGGYSGSEGEVEHDLGLDAEFHDRALIT